MCGTSAGRMGFSVQLDIAYASYGDLTTGSAEARVEIGDERFVGGEPVSMVSDMDIGTVGENPVDIVSWL